MSQHRSFPCLTLFLLLVCGILLFCRASAASAVERHYLWESREQFVALEPKDAGGVNSHPAEIDSATVRLLFGALALQASPSDKPVPLFTAETLDHLANRLSQALRQAQPTQDVTFAVIGLREALYGLAKQPQVTTGRVFVSDGKLHLIVGIAHREVKDREDRRMAPFTPGNSKTALAGSWNLLAPTGQTGIEIKRRDWVAVPLEWAPPPPPPPAAAVSAPGARPLSAEPPPITPPQAAGQRSPAERLILLRDLHEKGLITSDEYQQKRQEILQGL